ncbi:MAG: efflux RND transporter periplasmic adaptor subunit [Deltaproteobacteria bacterium]|nr:efflux RND transporter periplasmic adaptor subunit [Deltaproteobacteria bacterium]
MRPYFTLFFSSFFSILFLNSISLFAVQDPKSKPIVMARAAEKKKMVDLLIYPARVESRINANLLAEFDGAVVRVAAPLGKKVKKGELILVLKHTDPIYSYSNISLRAPVSGVVSELAVNEGSIISRGQKLATVTDPSQLKVAIEVPLHDLSALKVGMSGEFKSNARAISNDENELKSLPVEIAGISPLADPVTGTTTAILHFSKSLSHLGIISEILPGSLGRATFENKPRMVFSVPESAVIYRDDKTFLRLVKDGKMSQQEVVLGPMQSGQVEVQKGLETGALVIERSSKFIAPGDEVILEKDSTSDKSKKAE